MILMIDNYDSFTYNLVQYLGELRASLNINAEIKVVRNDQFELSDIARWKPRCIIISPGPCSPDEAGLCVALVKEYGASIPMFGVCLGYQCMIQALGGKVVHAKQVMHGKTSLVQHDGSLEYLNIPQPFEATRYHSLVADMGTFPKDLIVSAWTQSNCGQIEELMGFRHRTWPLIGVQYHPESILTLFGKDILRNFLVRYLKHS